MKTVVGVFKSRSAAELGSAAVVALGISRDKINILTPEATDKELAHVPTLSTEQPGMGKAMGATVGGAIGLAGAGMLGSLLVPGLGPVLAIGLAGGVLGAVGGGAAGGALEDADTSGLPEDELFVYEDALRQGRTVVVVMADDDSEAVAVRGTLEAAGAESVDRAREMWWVGLRSAEKETYETHGGNFEQDERYFRCGFEAAQHSNNRGKSYDECRARLGERYPDEHKLESFRRGYERGRTYFETIEQRSREKI
ncbi:MAG TPA: hypothetical protein VGF61_18665 [Candidatus Acidoferrum sp.]|jgi:hypothetical protein